MDKIIGKIVNKAFTGEPEHPVLQETLTNKTFEFSQIKYIVENGTTTSLSLNDKDLGQDLLQRILGIPNHVVEISIDENNEVTLHF